MMSLFGKKKEPKAPSTADTLALLAENIALLEKKQEHLQAKITSETTTARKNASTNKRAALAALKRKKLYENQCNKLQDTIVTLQQQEIALQNLATNVEILSTMNQVKDTMKAATKNMTVDDVDQTMDDVRDQVRKSTFFFLLLTRGADGHGRGAEQCHFAAHGLQPL